MEDLVGKQTSTESGDKVASKTRWKRDAGGERKKKKREKTMRNAKGRV